MNTNVADATPVVERQFFTLRITLVVAATVFLTLLAVVRPGGDPRAMLLALSFIIGFLADLAVSAVREMNRECTNAGDRYRFCERHIGQIETFLFDNPAIGADARIREALLPDDHDLTVLRFHPSWAKVLREMRAGTHWKLRGGVHNGPSLKLNLCLKPAAHDRDEYPVLPTDRNTTLVERIGRELAQGHGNFAVWFDLASNRLILEGESIRQIVRIAEELR